MTVLNTETREGHRYLALLDEMGLGDEPTLPETGQSNISHANTNSALNIGPTGEVGTP